MAASVTNLQQHRLAVRVAEVHRPLDALAHPLHPQLGGCPEAVHAAVAEGRDALTKHRNTGTRNTVLCGTRDAEGTQKERPGAEGPTWQNSTSPTGANSALRADARQWKELACT